MSDKASTPIRTYTIKEVGEMFRIPPAKVRDRCKQRVWPHMDISARTIRFTQEQVDAIVELMTKAPQDPEPRRGPMSRRRLHERRTAG